MRASLLLSVSLSLLAGCRQTVEISDGYCDHLDLKTSTPMDMDMAMPVKCAAAKGLGGDNMLCVDFSSIPDQPLDNPGQLPAQLSGWDFVTNCGGKYWEISGGKLQIKNFGTFGTTCGFSIKPIDMNDADKQKYQSIALSISQKVDLDLGSAFPNQFAQVYNGTAIPAFLLTQTTGTLPEQQATLSFDKDKLPAATKNVAKYLVQVQAGSANASKQGLQISSIAINLSSL